LPGVAYPGVRDNRSTLNTKTGYDDDTHIHQTASFAKMWLRPNVFILFLTFRVIHCATGQVQLLFQVTTWYIQPSYHKTSTWPTNKLHQLLWALQHLHIFSMATGKDTENDAEERQMLRRTCNDQTPSSWTFIVWIQRCCPSDHSFIVPSELPDKHYK